VANLLIYFLKLGDSKVCPAWRSKLVHFDNFGAGFRNSPLPPAMAKQPLVSQGLLITSASKSHSQTHTTVGRTSLDEWSARRRDLYLTTHNTHKKQTYMPLAGFEPAIPVSERPQTHALGSAATRIGQQMYVSVWKYITKTQYTSGK
jgi:hypothetical protein